MCVYIISLDDAFHTFCAKCIRGLAVRRPGLESNPEPCVHRPTLYQLSYPGSPALRDKEECLFKCLHVPFKREYLPACWHTHTHTHFFSSVFGVFIMRFRAFSGVFGSFRARPTFDLKPMLSALLITGLRADLGPNFSLLISEVSYNRAPSKRVFVSHNKEQCKSGIFFLLLIKEVFYNRAPYKRARL